MFQSMSLKAIKPKCNSNLAMPDYDFFFGEDHLVSKRSIQVDKMRVYATCNAYCCAD